MEQIHIRMYSRSSTLINCGRFFVNSLLDQALALVFPATPYLLSALCLICIVIIINLVGILFILKCSEVSNNSSSDQVEHFYFSIDSCVVIARYLIDDPVMNIGIKRFVLLSLVVLTALELWIVGVNRYVTHYLAHIQTIDTPVAYLYLH